LNLPWRLRPGIVDRYIVAELAGPFAFGLAAFTLILAVALILPTSKFIAEEHAPLWAAIQYFLAELVGYFTLIVPLAMLLGTLLAVQRLSGDSEITALRAGGVGLGRIVVPFLFAGTVASLGALGIQEGIVPLANDRATYLREEIIKNVGTLVTTSNTVTTPLPDGGRQITYFTGYDKTARALLHVTLVKYDARNQPQLVVFTDRARYGQLHWTFDNAREYRFSPDGTTTFYSFIPVQEIDIGEQATQIERRVASNNPDEMSRAQIRDIIASGQLAPGELRAYRTAFAEKLARPFAAFVLTLIAVPFGLRPVRGGGGAGLGFGVAVAIGFGYYVLESIASAVSSQIAVVPLVATIGAWTPNLLFCGIGALLVRRAAQA